MASLSSPPFANAINMPPYDRGSSVGSSANGSPKMTVRVPPPKRHHFAEEPTTARPGIATTSLPPSFGASMVTSAERTDASSVGISRSAQATARAKSSIRAPPLQLLQGHNAFQVRKALRSTTMTTCATCLIGLEVPTVSIGQAVLCESCRASRGVRISRSRPSVVPNLNLHMLKPPLVPSPIMTLIAPSLSLKSEMDWKRLKMEDMDVDKTAQSQLPNLHANSEPEGPLIIDLTYPDEEPADDVRARVDVLTLSSSKSAEATDQPQASISSLNQTISSLSPGEQRCETPDCVRTVPSGLNWGKCTVCTLARWDAIRSIKRESAPPTLPNAAVESPEPIMKVEPRSPIFEAQGTRSTPIDLDVPSVVPSREECWSRSSSPEIPLREQFSRSSSPEVPLQQCLSWSSSPEVPLRRGLSRSSPSSPASSAEIYKHGPNTSISGWDSDLTDLTSDGEGETELDDDKPRRHASGIKIRVPVFAKVGGSKSPLRICAMRKCNVVLSVDHQWKVCNPCRRHHRAYQRLRLERLRRRSAESSSEEDLGGDNEEHRLKLKIKLNPQSSSSAATANGHGLSVPNTRRCNYSYCARPLPPEDQYQFKLCPSCRARARRSARRRRDEVEDAIFALDLGEKEDKKQEETMMRYEAFQDVSALFAAFRARLEAFVQAHVLYLRAKLRELVILSWGKDRARVEAMIHEQRLRATFFAFDGEYSSVLSGCDGQNLEPGGSFDSGFCDAEGMQRELGGLARRVGEMLHTEFSPFASFAVKDGGLIMRYTAELDLVLPRDGWAPPTDEPTADGAREVRPFVKRLRNELEIAIVPDQSHKFFTGRRIVLRFRLLG